MSARIFHNPRCSKSRATLALLKESVSEIEVVEYLVTPPAVEELETICQMLGVEPIDIIRTKDSLFSELGLSAGDSRSRVEWLRILAGSPGLLERPIVVYKGRAAVGRPPENVLGIL